MKYLSQAFDDFSHSETSTLTLPPTANAHTARAARRPGRTGNDLTPMRGTFVIGMHGWANIA
jgi:hypothetical protein